MPNMNRTANLNLSCTGALAAIGKCLMLLWMVQAGTALQAAPEPGNVTVAVGEVTVIAPGEAEPRPLAAGDRVAVGSVVKTGAGARAVIVMTPRSAIRVAENTELTIETVEAGANPPKVTVDLRDGSLGAMMKPEDGQIIDFQIRTPSGIAAARGTFFAVVVEDGVGFAQVREGRVELRPERAAAQEAEAGDDPAPTE